MSTTHDVVVYDRVPTRATVSSAQAESWMRRNGYHLYHSDDFERCWERLGCTIVTPIEPDSLALEDWIEDLAHIERMQPSAVLADIAKEEA